MHTSYRPEENVHTPGPPQDCSLSCWFSIFGCWCWIKQTQPDRSSHALLVRKPEPSQIQTCVSGSDPPTRLYSVHETQVTDTDVELISPDGDGASLESRGFFFRLTH